METQARPTMVERRPFAIRLSGHDIMLSGVLHGQVVVPPSAEKDLRAAARFNRVTVDASLASILEGGADVWVGFVQEYFKNCELRYRRSQLGMILSFDNSYRTLHPGSFFDDDE